MKLIPLAVVVGLAVAAALLGMGFNGAGSARTLTEDVWRAQDVSPAAVTARDNQSEAPGAHDDGNRARAVYLNENVINGVTTRVCAADAAMHAAPARSG